jgi:hypothetical protein
LAEGDSAGETRLTDAREGWMLIPTAAPVAALPNRLPSPDHPLNTLENEAFSGDLEGAQAEYSSVFSPNLRILSKA